MEDTGALALELLNEDFISDDIKIKHRASEKLDLVAKVLGPKKTRDVLIPWMVKNMNEQEDQILYIFARKCTPLLKLVGGPEHSESLLPVLEALLIIEESCVREAALSCMRDLISQPIGSKTKSIIVKFVLKLSKEEWFTSRMSTCALIGPLLCAEPIADDIKILKEVFFVLCNDETPMIRCATSQQVSDVVKFMNKKETIEMLSLFSHRCTDPQESVAIKWIGSISKLFQALSGNPDFVEDEILDYVKKFSKSLRWRVRCTIARQFDSITASAKLESSRNDLLLLYIDLIKDVESEVRQEATVHLAKICQLVGVAPFVEKVFPEVFLLAKSDVKQSVRLNICEAAVSDILWDALGTEMIKAHLLSLWELFLKDTETTMIPEICLLVLKSVDSIVNRIGSDCVAKSWGTRLRSLYDVSKRHNEGGNDPQSDDDVNKVAMVDDVEHPQWRLRIAILHAVSQLSRSTDESVKNLLMDLWVSGLKDEVYEVRLNAAKILGEFCEPNSVVGIDRVSNDFIPVLLSYFESAKCECRKRIIFLHAFRALFVAEPSLAEPLLDNFEACLHDNVANVRLAAVVTAREIVDESLIQRYGKHFTALCSDPDKDVSELAGSVVNRQIVAK